MSGMQERAARALADALGWDPYDSQTAATASLGAAAVLAVAADVDGIAGVLLAHQSVPMYEVIELQRHRCGGCGIETNGGPNSPDHVHHVAEMLAAYILDRP